LSPSTRPASPAEIRAVAIDLDGTLLDTAGEIASAVNAMLAAVLTGSPRRDGVHDARSMQRPAPRSLSVDEVRAMIGQGLAVLVDRALTAALGRAPDSALAAHAFALCQEAYFEVLGTSAAPFAGVAPGLDALQAMALPLACVTNKPTRFTLPLLERSGLADRFDHVVCGDTYERKKPDPLPLLRTAERFACAPSQLLMIGDSIHDVNAARAGGCPVVCVPYGYRDGQPVESLEVDGMIRDLSEAASWIRRWNERSRSGGERDPEQD
jgi:phosphoglycolate phosphatase